MMNWLSIFIVVYWAQRAGELGSLPRGGRQCLIALAAVSTGSCDQE